MKFLFLIFCSGLFNLPPVSGADKLLFSPDKKIEVAISIGEKINYSVTFSGKQLIMPSSISLRLSGGVILGKDPVLLQAVEQTHSEMLYPVVAWKNKEIKEAYNKITFTFKNNYSVIFRAYNEGVAYRFVTRMKGAITIEEEEATFNFTGDYGWTFPEESNFVTVADNGYVKDRLSNISFNRFSAMPALVDFDNGYKMLITEADLQDYPGMYLRGNSNHSLYGKFPSVPVAQLLDKTIKGWDRHVVINERHPYIARTSGNRSFPWRIMVITEKDAALLENELVYQLSPPNRLTDVSWIKPGKAAWDWWNYNNITGVDFKAGINTQTYQYYIDFAAKQGLDYIIIDEGWYVLGDLFKVVPDMSMEEIISYAKKKGIGVFLWVVWKTLNDQLGTAMDLFQKWGVKGLKVDFMERDDQFMINQYYKIAEEAAKRKLMVEFHTSSKPDGIRRAYPNVITRDLSPGLEYNKWAGKKANPEMAVTLPFIRMVAGPMDYTPGAMNNATQDDYMARFKNPMSLGTRCQQMALFVVYESPLTVMADSPSNYYKEQECTDFIARIPTTWDRTIALDGKVGEYLAIARKKDREWYLGAMTNWTPREIQIKLDFLDPGTYTLEFFRDGVNADRNATDYKKEIIQVSDKKEITLQLMPGGGWVGRIYQ